MQWRRRRRLRGKIINGWRRAARQLAKISARRRNENENDGVGVISISNGASQMAKKMAK